MIFACGEPHTAGVTHRQGGPCLGECECMPCGVRGHPFVDCADDGAEGPVCPQRGGTDTWFDRPLCPEPCGSMHDRCTESGADADCTCGSAGAAFIPAGHYHDCPWYTVPVTDTPPHRSWWRRLFRR
ncbi:hypothetical protein [Streptomyces sp. NPDC094032]|uniref:hypothetical protein n=1 Tax=Streptomyces sp. NPDC094032 TaxID=3155308 RepID=UPI00332BABA3